MFTGKPMTINEQKPHLGYSLRISHEDMRVIAAALQDLPYRIVAPVLARLQAQTDEQDAEQGSNEGGYTRHVEPPGLHHG